MFEALTARGREAAREAAARTRARIAEQAAAEAPPGTRIGPAGDAVAISGRRLRERLAVDARLRQFLETLR
jgi:hypothetical protein